MARTTLQVADIFRDHGPAWRSANAGHVSLGQLKVMSAIEDCRTAALGGHVARCENEKCGHTQIAYNSCRNRHCPKCQGTAAREWLAEREKELLPVPYFHVVFSMPAQIADIAYQNKAAIYGILFKASAETMLTIAADPKHLGARIGVLSVLHTWGSALTHHPHVHMIVPGGGISLDGKRWIACRPNFFLPVRVLSRLFRRLVLDKLTEAHRAGQLQFFGQHASLTNAQAFAAYLTPLRKKEWVVYSKRPFAGPEEVLRYLARYTHRVAISNSRLISQDDKGVTFKWKDYRLEGSERYNKVMTLPTHEFIRRFLMHVLPAGFHRIRYYGFLTCQTRAKNIARIRELLEVPLIPVDAIKAASAKASTSALPEEPKAPEHPCPCCGSNMRIIETFLRGQQPKNKPTPVPQKFRIDTS
jgi:Putative transposase/Transposase zinc-binding domain